MGVTSLCAGLLGILFIVLSARVILTRRSEQVNLGHGGKTVLERRIRAQGNLTEYGPFALILLGFLEFREAPSLIVIALGVALVLGRYMHGWALSFTAGNVPGRIGGMVLTLTVIGVAALMNVAYSII